MENQNIRKGTQVLYGGKLYRVITFGENLKHKGIPDIILIANDEERFSINETDCIVMSDSRFVRGGFDNMGEEVSAVDGFLRENGLHSDDIHHESGMLAIHISWGDWKHDHMFLDQLMSRAGYSIGSSVLTDEDGSDTYSAMHFFHK